MMDVTPEMVEAYVADQLPWMGSTDRLRIMQGIAIYKHLDSPASDEWRQQHGFKTDARVVSRFRCMNSLWHQCIPYNDDTKHLLGTFDMCDERFINW